MLTASRNKNFLQSKFQIFHDFSTLKMMSSFFGKINLECTVCVFLIDCVFDRVCRYLHDSVLYIYFIQMRSKWTRWHQTAFVYSIFISISFNGFY